MQVNIHDMAAFLTKHEVADYGIPITEEFVSKFGVFGVSQITGKSMAEIQEIFNAERATKVSSGGGKRGRKPGSKNKPKNPDGTLVEQNTEGQQNEEKLQFEVLTQELPLEDDEIVALGEETGIGESNNEETSISETSVSEKSANKKSKVRA